jgi:hypothetical protein
MFKGPVNYNDMISDDVIEDKFHLILKNVKGLLLIGKQDPEYMPIEFQKLCNFRSNKNYQDKGIDIYK